MTDSYHDEALESIKSVLLNIAVIADVHTDGDPVRDRNNTLRRIFAGILKSSPRLDALVMAGDITNSAAECEYVNLKRMLNVYNRVETVIPAMGNHDTRGTSIYPDFDEASVFFRDFCAYTGIRTEKNYYSTSVKCYRFIVMGSEALLQDNAYISNEQLTWLDGELKEASNEKKPVFIICHQPLAGTVPGGAAEGYVGKQSDSIKAIIEKYTENGMTVLFLSGHRHSELSQKMLTRNGNLWCADLPTVLFSGNGNKPGDGVTVEVYSDRIVLRAIDFFTVTRYDKYRFEIPLA